VLVIGVTNQRETTILWDKHTGKVLHNALVWLDKRSEETVDYLLKEHNKDKTCLQVSLIFLILFRWIHIFRNNVVYHYQPIFLH
jgi:glycerol kinase